MKMKQIQCTCVMFLMGPLEEHQNLEQIHRFVQFLNQMWCSCQSNHTWHRNPNNLHSTILKCDKTWRVQHVSPLKKWIRQHKAFESTSRSTQSALHTFNTFRAFSISFWLAYYYTKYMNLKQRWSLHHVIAASLTLWHTMHVEFSSFSFQVAVRTCNCA